MKKSFLVCAACLLLAAVCIGWSIHAGAATGDGTTALTVKEINYENSTITLESSAGDKVVYFSDSKQKKWERMGEFEDDSQIITLDISWVSVSKDYVLSFKGDVSTNVDKVKLPKQVTNFKVKFVVNGGTLDDQFLFTNKPAERAVQWRKNGMSAWKEWNTKDSSTAEVLKTELAALKSNGATLYFRLAPENGTASNAGLRASKEVSVKVPAKKAAPTIKVDASKYTVELPSTMSYRIGEEGKWINGTGTCNLFDIAPELKVGIDGKAATEKITLQAMTNATASSQESRVASVVIPPQGEAPTVSGAGITYAYTSSSSLEIAVGVASNSNLYEYCVIKKDEYETKSWSYADLRWTSISSSANVKVTASNAPAGSHIYVRKKSVGSQGEDSFALASAEVDVIPEGVAYPDPAKMDQEKTITVPAGSINTSGYGTQSESFVIYSKTETTISSIVFYEDVNNNLKSRGSVECSSSVAENGDKKGTDDPSYIITTVITSTAALDKNSEAIGKDLYAEITFANGDKIAADKNSPNALILHLDPPTKVTIPAESEKLNYGSYYTQYTNSFKRWYQSNENDNTFKFILEFGTKTTKNGAELEIESISYDAYKIQSITEFKGTEVATGSSIDAKEAAYYTELKKTNANAPEVMVHYEDYTKDGNTYRRAYVTVHVDQFEKNSGANNSIGSSVPFIITLNNGEVLYNGVTMTLVRTATIKNPVFWTFSAGSLPTFQLDADKKEIPLYSSYTLELTKTEGNLNIGVNSVTWNGTDISFNSSSSSADYAISISLSNASLNKLGKFDQSGINSKTGDLKITLSNGYVVEEGCKLTINKE